MDLSEFQKYSRLDNNFTNNASKLNKNDLLTSNLYKKVIDFFTTDSNTLM